MESITTFLFGCLALAVGLGYAFKHYAELPKSGYYNRPEEKKREANRHRFNDADFRVVIGLVCLGLALIVAGLG